RVLATAASVRSSASLADRSVQPFWPSGHRTSDRGRGPRTPRVKTEKSAVAITRRRFLRQSLVLAAATPAGTRRAHAAPASPLGGEKALTQTGAFAFEMVAGLHRDLDARLAAALELDASATPTPGSREEQVAWAAARRARLRTIIGAVDERLPPEMQALMPVGGEPVIG